MPQSLNQPYGPSLHSLWYAHVSLVVGSPELDTAFQVWPHQHWVEGKHHLPQPAARTFSNAAQGTISLLPEDCLISQCAEFTKGL